jgi:hypothetical protein
MSRPTEKIPIIEWYKNIGIHDQQSPERINGVVKKEIDEVFAMDDIVQLAEFAADVGNCQKPGCLLAL